jgi:hypothetical protein
LSPGTRSRTPLSANPPATPASAAPEAIRGPLTLLPMPAARPDRARPFAFAVPALELARLERDADREAFCALALDPVRDRFGVARPELDGRLAVDALALEDRLAADALAWVLAPPLRLLELAFVFDGDARRAEPVRVGACAMSPPSLVPWIYVPSRGGLTLFA